MHKVTEKYKNRAKAKGIIVGEYINIIPRPFMEMSIKNNKDKWLKQIKKLLLQNNVETTLQIMGEIISKNIQDTIAKGDFEPNPLWVQHIKEKDTPLIDTGDMLKNVSYEVI